MAKYETISLTSMKAQCIHAYYTSDDDTVHCPSYADPYSGNGWLCTHHNVQLDMTYRHHNKRPNQSRDQETIAHIIGTERRALANAQRERVRLTTKGLFIQYLA